MDPKEGKSITPRWMKTKKLLLCVDDAKKKRHHQDLNFVVKVL